MHSKEYPSFLLLLFSVCLFFSGCETKKIRDESIVKVEIGDRTPVNISYFTSEMKAIKLETSSECFLADITDIKINHNQIYITDVIFKGIYVFDLSGNLLRTFNKEGKGVGEYLSIDDFIIDNSKNTIEVFDRTNMKIYIYDYTDFRFKESISLPFSFSFNFAKKNDTYYFQTNDARNEIDGEFSNSEIISFNNLTQHLEPLFEKVLPVNENQTWEFGNVFTLNEGGELFASFAWHNKIYKIEKNRALPVITVDAGSEGFPHKIISGRYKDKMSFLNSHTVKNKIHFFKLLMYENENFIIGYGKGYPPKICYYIQLSNGEIINTNNLQNDYLPFIQQNLVIFKKEKEFLLSVIYPYKENKNEQLLKYFKIEKKDNPIILFFKIEK